MTDDLLGATLDAEELPRHHVARRALCLTILFHPDTRRIGEVAYGLPKAVDLSRLAPLFAPPGQSPESPLADPCLSRTPVRLLTLAKRAVKIVPDEKASPLFVDGKAVVTPLEVGAAALEQGVALRLLDRVVLLLHMCPPPSPASDELGLVGASQAVQTLRARIANVVDLVAPVLLIGETGVGKELVARAIHQSGPRAHQPCVTVNMAAVPTAMAASALFGHAKGSFTGADRQHDGYFVQADGGTLFLDEIGATPPDVQAMLLRVLESGEIQSVGGKGIRKVDVRIIAATDEDLDEAVEAGRFRAPLFHRLSGLCIDVAPVRERREDLGRLWLHLIRQELAAVGEEHRLQAPEGAKAPWTPASLVSTLARHPLPGNVRELRNIVRRFVVANRGREYATLDPDILALLGTELQPVASMQPSSIGRRGLDEVDEEELVAALRRHQWKLTRVAADLGISRTSLYALVDRSPRIRKAKDLSRAEIEQCRDECQGRVDAMAQKLEVSERALKLRMGDLGLG